jgi:hypothetical protein
MCGSDGNIDIAFHCYICILDDHIPAQAFFGMSKNIFPYMA